MILNIKLIFFIIFKLFWKMYEIRKMGNCSVGDELRYHFQIPQKSERSIIFRSSLIFSNVKFIIGLKTLPSYPIIRKLSLIIRNSNRLDFKFCFRAKLGGWHFLISNISTKRLPFLFSKYKKSWVRFKTAKFTTFLSLRLTF